MDQPLLEDDLPVTPVALYLSAAESSAEAENLRAEMRMIEDPVLTLCHYPSPGSNPPERKKTRTLPTVSLSLLCFSPPHATTPPQSPRASGGSPPSFDDAAVFSKPHRNLLDRIEDSLNTPVTGAEGFFGASLPLLDPPPIGEYLSFLKAPLRALSYRTWLERQSMDGES